MSFEYLYNLQEAVPVPAPPPAPAAPVPVEKEATEEPIFRGEENSSKYGVYPVLVYDVPGSERCYVFQHHKNTAGGDSLIYRCSGFRHQNQKFTSVLVTDDIFHKDACRLNHNCIPLNRYIGLSTRNTHIYYSKDVISMVCENGLSALIGVGVHKLNSVSTPNRMDKGQLHAINGVIRGGIEVPLLYAVTRYKTLTTYRTIFWTSP
ncbi:hypothetical protein Aduo_009170 [Ancylostoma duodenale]